MTNRHAMVRILPSPGDTTSSEPAPKASPKPKSKAKKGNGVGGFFDITMLRSIILLLKLQRACCHKRVSHVFAVIQWLWVCSSRNLCPVVSSLSKRHIDIKDVITGFYFHNII